MKKYFLSFVFLFSIVFTNAQSNGNVKAIPFQEEINAFIKNDSVQMPAANSILFVGSSSFTIWKDITNYFPGYPILNRGFGGSSLPDVVCRTG